MGRATNLLVLALLPLCVACPTTESREPVIEIEGHRMLVHPFRDRFVGPYESRAGSLLARYITNELRSYHEEDEDDAIDVVPFEDLVREVSGIKKQDPFTIAPHEMAKRLKADRVLIGSIARFQTSIPGDVGLRRGVAEVSLRVVDVKKPDGPPLVERQVLVRFPPESGFTGPGVLSSTEAREVDIERELLRELTEDIGKLFRYYEEDRHPDER